MLSITVEKLIYYGKCHLDLMMEDEMYVRNILLHFLNIDEPYDGEIDKESIENMTSPIDIIKELKSLNDKLSDNDIDFIFSLLTPRPKEIIMKFNDIYESQNPSDAIEYLYNLSIYNNYIKEERNKNIEWVFEGDISNFLVSINMMKTENTRKKDDESYPKCELCCSNVGYYGKNNDDSKSNLRIVPLNIMNEEWFLEPSACAYFNKHMLLITKDHCGVYTDKKTIEIELEFLDKFPHMFIGANPDIERVGSRNLNHMHFECGEETLPIMNAKIRYNLKKREIPDSEISYLDWYTSCFMIKSRNKNSIATLAELFIQSFNNYDDDSINLTSKDDKAKYSSVATLARKTDDIYILYLIPRNNRIISAYPNGIFNTRNENTNIKDDFISLKESCGLFFLPNRLNEEIMLIGDIISTNYYSISDMISKNTSLEKHLQLINNLLLKYGRKKSKETALELVKYEIGKLCEKILSDTSIFKDTIDGQIALFKFIDSLMLEVK